jgi:hypothetical protein
MELRDLMIGNYIFNSNNTAVKVDGLDSDGFVKVNGSWEAFSLFKPIPIDSIWLRNLGFVKQQLGMEDQYFIGCLRWSRSFAQFFVRFYESGRTIDEKYNLQYVHQVQNLYHSLYVDRELTLSTRYYY